MSDVNSGLVTTSLTSVAIAGFAANALLARAALGSELIGAGSFTAIRLASGALVLLPWMLCGRHEPPDWRGVLSLLVYCTAFSFAYVELEAASGALLLFVAVQATILVTGYLAGKPIRAAGVIGIALAIAGVNILLEANGRNGPMLPMLAMGAAGVAWGVYSMLGRSVADAVGHKRPRH